MSLCLMNVHGDIEGDYEFIRDIPNNATNGEVIQALFPNIDNNFSNVLDLRLWWGRPYKAESPETCKGCLEPCIMYEPDMRGCKKKVTEKGGE